MSFDIPSRPIFIKYRIVYRQILSVDRNAATLLRNMNNFYEAHIVTIENTSKLSDAFGLLRFERATAIAPALATMLMSGSNRSSKLLSSLIAFDSDQCPFHQTLPRALDSNTLSAGNYDRLLYDMGTWLASDNYSDTVSRFFSMPLMRDQIDTTREVYHALTRGEPTALTDDVHGVDVAVLPGKGQWDVLEAYEYRLNRPTIQKDGDGSEAVRRVTAARQRVASPVDGYAYQAAELYVNRLITSGWVVSGRDKRIMLIEIVKDAIAVVALAKLLYLYMPHVRRSIFSADRASALPDNPFVVGMTFALVSRSDIANLMKSGTAQDAQIIQQIAMRLHPAINSMKSTYANRLVISEEIDKIQTATREKRVPTLFWTLLPVHTRLQLAHYFAAMTTGEETGADHETRILNFVRALCPSTDQGRRGFLANHGSELLLGNLLRSRDNRMTKAVLEFANTSSGLESLLLQLKEGTTSGTTQVTLEELTEIEKLTDSFKTLSIDKENVKLGYDQMKKQYYDCAKQRDALLVFKHKIIADIMPLLRQGDAERALKDLDKLMRAR